MSNQTTETIAIIDYGMGNLHSVRSALQTVSPDSNVVVTADPSKIAMAERVVFPGVGAIGDCIAEIKRLGIDQVVNRVIKDKKPLLSICVGMQALMSFSEESGGTACLNVFEGDVRSFSNNEQFNATTDESSDSAERLKVPHMGWNQVEQTMAHPLWEGIENNSRFYFVHSYFVTPGKPELCAGRTHYGIDFAATIAQDTIFAAQFHPEKSHKNGLRLLRNFVNWQV